MNYLIYFVIIVAYLPTHTLAQDNNFNLAGLERFEVKVNVGDRLTKEYGRSNATRLEWDLESDLKRDLRRAGAESLMIFSDDFVEPGVCKVVVDINAVFIPECDMKIFAFNVTVKVIEEVPLKRLKEEYSSAITWEKAITWVAQYNDSSWDLVKEKFEEVTEIFIKDYRRDNRWR